MAKQAQKKAMKMLKCGSVVPGCNVVLHGESEADVMMKAAEHARAQHGVEHMSDELKAKVRAAIQDA
jgi:predicted small metal-binding protein